jgi:hypothetical protein
MGIFQNPSATDSGKTEDFHLQLARGHISNHSSVHKFGWNTGVGTSEETVWDGSNVYSYSAIGTATAHSTTDGSDSASTVTIQGLDENFLLVTDTLTVDGAASANQYSRIFRAYMATANTGTTNVNSVDIKTRSNTIARISAGQGQTLMALYTIPANKTGYLKQVQFTSNKTGQPAVFRILSRVADGNPANEGPFRTIGQFGQMDGPTQYEYNCSIRLASNTDIEIRATGTASAPACGAVFDLILIDGQDTVEPGTGVD